MIFTGEVLGNYYLCLSEGNESAPCGSTPLQGVALVCCRHSYRFPYDEVSMPRCASTTALCSDGCMAALIPPAIPLPASSSPPPFPFSLQVSHLHFRLGVGAMQAAFPADDSHLGRSRRAGMSSSHTQRYVLAALWVLSISSWPHPKNREGRVAPCSESWG